MTEEVTLCVPLQAVPTAFAASHKAVVPFQSPVVAAAPVRDVMLILTQATAQAVATAPAVVNSTHATYPRRHHHHVRSLTPIS